MVRDNKFLVVVATSLIGSVLPVASYSQESSAIFYGQLNYAGLFYDDGAEKHSYAVDNANSNSRVGMRYFFPHLEDDTLQFNVEIGLGTTLSDSVSQLSTDTFRQGWSEANLRKAEFIYSPHGYGKVFLGQGSMATDGISYLDYSGTDVVATASVRDPAGGQFFRRVDGTLSTVTFGSAVNDFDGAKRFRIRYDTPKTAGFTFSAALGRELLTRGAGEYFSDAELLFSEEYENFSVTAGLGYNWSSQGYQTITGAGGLLHNSTGLNASIVTGADNNDGAMIYGKLGLIRSYFNDDTFKTALSVDYYYGENINLRNSKTNSLGLAVVQNFGENFQVYGLFRTQDYDDKFNSYFGGQGFFVGARYRFSLGLGKLPIFKNSHLLQTNNEFKN